MRTLHRWRDTGSAAWLVVAAAVTVLLALVTVPVPPAWAQPQATRAEPQMAPACRPAR